MSYVRSIIQYEGYGKMIKPQYSGTERVMLQRHINSINDKLRLLDRPKSKAIH
jgi:hypothetical protein